MTVWQAVSREGGEVSLLEGASTSLCVVYGRGPLWVRAVIELLQILQMRGRAWVNPWI